MRNSICLKGFAGIVLALAINSQAANAAAPSGYEWTATFFDEFIGSSLDQTKWQAFTTTDPRLQSVRIPQNVVVGNGLLHIYNRLEQCQGKPWTGGFVKSRSSQAYGYFEARMRYAKGTGLNNAFWLISDLPVIKGGNEIDINEGRGPNLVRCALHLSEKRNWHFQVELPDDASQNFHTYGVLWLPKPEGGAKVTWYVDDRPGKTIECEDISAPARILFSTAVYAAKNPSPDLDGSPMDIEWVRAFQINSSGKKHQ